MGLVSFRNSILPLVLVCLSCISTAAASLLPVSTSRAFFVASSLPQVTPSPVVHIPELKVRQARNICSGWSVVSQSIGKTWISKIQSPLVLRTSNLIVNETILQTPIIFVHPHTPVPSEISTVIYGKPAGYRGQPILRIPHVLNTRIFH